jgi:crossover junction endodeoxyribonuclease RusA
VIKFSVNGKPAPQGSKTRNRAGAVYESSKAVAPWREAIRAETQRACEVPLAGPVSVLIGFRMTRPKSHYRTGRNAHLLKGGAPGYPDGKPDLDKLARAVLDGLKEGGAFWDDAQVVTLAVAKAYADASGPGADIEVTEVNR